MVVALALLAGACSWRRLGAQADVHAQVLLAEARKGRDLVVHGRLTAETMPELTYPLERARAFASSARTRGTPPAWLPAFDDLIARYRAFVDALDRVRRTHRGRAARAALAAPLGEVKAGARAVRAVVRAERRA